MENRKVSESLYRNCIDVDEERKKFELTALKSATDRYLFKERSAILNSKMFSRFRKMTYWSEIGEIKGFHDAIEALGSNWQLLDEDAHGYTDISSIWGQLASNTELKNKHTHEARKWLYTTWHRDREGIRTKFYAKMGVALPQAPEHRTHNDGKNQNESTKVCKRF